MIRRKIISSIYVTDAEIDLSHALQILLRNKKAFSNTVHLQMNFVCILYVSFVFLFSFLNIFSLFSNIVNGSVCCHIFMLYTLHANSASRLNEVYTSRKESIVNCNVTFECN